METVFHFSLFMISICVSIIPAVLSQCVADQQLSLLQLKTTLVFDLSLSSKLITWNSSTNCCHWGGVTCNTDGYVVGLDISGESISCSIDDSSSLFDLQHLQSLNLASDYIFNDFNNSQIPSAIGKLSNLRYLNLSLSGFSGQIPFEISGLTSLVVLELSKNFNSGGLKLENPNLRMLVHNLKLLEELYLDDVNISTHRTDWCQTISYSLPNLRVLSLVNTGISGPFDHSLSKLKSLAVIELSMNNISAPVPQFFSTFSNLTYLSLMFCELHGTFPKEIFQLPSLQSILLRDNPDLHGSLPEFPTNGSLRLLFLSGSNFSGFLPNSIGNLKMLSTIYLGNCNFSGSIPGSIGNLTQLVELDISSNRITGQIDFIHWENLVNLEFLSFQSNLLSGNIPSSIFSPPFLKMIFFSGNQFSGPLLEFTNISSYLWITLDLSNNNLEGPIPVSIFKLRGISQLLLSSNNFSSFPFNGPQILGNLTKIDLSYNSLLVLYNGTNSSSSSFPQVTELNLASNKLRAFPDFLRNHSKLYSLDLSANQIQGQIPNWIWSLQSLTYMNLSCNSFETLEGPLLNSTSILDLLDLHSNQLQGEIPTFLPTASFLDYSSNKFSSNIPGDIGDALNLRFLSLSSNNLQGLIPVSLCNASRLELLDLSNNSLSGTIPACLSQRELGVLNLRRNKFTGIISSFEFPELSKLKTLSLSENHIEGQFPKSLGNCTELEVLNIANNQITDTFPCFLKGIPTLRVLILRSNKFYGSIGCPETNGTWPLLQIIDLAQNNFSGAIPQTSLATWQAMVLANGDVFPFNNLGFTYSQGSKSGIFVYIEDAITTTSVAPTLSIGHVSRVRHSTTLRHSPTLSDTLPTRVEIVSSPTSVFTLIDLSSNKFNGSIPEEMGEFAALYVLNLSSNAFTGEIPASFGNMRQLESLDLSKNNLSGQIPVQLTKLTFLAVLDISYNQLVGRIPTSTQFSTFPKASFEENKDLQGPPLTVDDTASLSPDSSTTLEGSHQNSQDKIDWDLISIEIGFTFGFGIAIGSLFFCKKWRKWYYRAMYNILLKIFPQLEQRFGNHRRHVYANQRHWRH